MMEAGLRQDEIEHLERLSHPEVLRSLPPSERGLRHHSREDAVRYFRAWADLLESQLSEIERERMKTLGQRTPQPSEVHGQPGKSQSLGESEMRNKAGRAA